MSLAAFVERKNIHFSAIDSVFNDEIIGSMPGTPTIRRLDSTTRGMCVHSFGGGPGSGDVPLRRGQATGPPWRVRPSGIHPPSLVGRRPSKSWSLEMGQALKNCCRRWIYRGRFDPSGLHPVGAAGVLA